MAKIKRHMTHEEEFEIMKLVLDKFLWIGVLIMGFGFYKMVSFNDDVSYGLMLLGAGAIILLIFVFIIMREYNFLTKK